MMKRGWGAEVLCFSCGFSGKLKQIAMGSGGRGKYINLDPWYGQLTYRQALSESGVPYVVRESEPLDLTGRPRV